MQTDLDKILDTCTQVFAAWMPQSDPADLMLGFIIGIFYVAVLCLFVRRATTARKSA